jgi:hypothetical protein
MRLLQYTSSDELA